MLVDTNILVYAINSDSPKHRASQNFLKENVSSLEIAHQNILEAVRVLTHPKFSHPMKLQDALESVMAISKSSRIIAPNASTLYLAIELLKIHKSTGNRIFDAYLAATAMSNNIDTIATDNTRDLQRFDELTIINPFK